VLHVLFSALTRKAPEQAKQQVQPPRRPAGRDRDAWHTFWAALGQSWRTEPEIDQTRQQELAERRIIVPNLERGIYPFKDMKLSRADVEWLLATHENGRGPVDWSDESQRERQGLDLRGTDLRYVDLNGLPLACLHAGITVKEMFIANEEQSTLAAVLMEGANLGATHLEGAQLYKAHLEEADLFQAYLTNTCLIRAHLEKVHFWEAHLERTDLRRAHLEGAYFERAVFHDEKHIGPRLADAHFGNVNLTTVDWSQVYLLHDEYVAQQKRRGSRVKSKTVRQQEYERAVRANRSLAVVLQSQGLNEFAARFAYRALILQKLVFRYQMTRPGAALRQRGQAAGAWLFSWFLYLIAGYGYRLWRSFLAYLLIISLFMTIYRVIDPHLAWSEAFVVSMTAFHGRGFSPSTFTPGDSLSFVSATEAFVGLIIEVTFIATLTRRFFGQ